MNTLVFLFMGAVGLITEPDDEWIVYKIDGWKGVLVTSLLYLWVALCMYLIHLGIVTP